MLHRRYTKSGNKTRQYEKVMRVEYKEYYYFEEVDKVLFTDFLRNTHTSMKDFADSCDISLSLLSLILNGKRAITKNVLNEFEKHGFKVEIK